MIKNNIMISPQIGEPVSRFLLRAIGRRSAMALFMIVCSMSLLDLVGIAIIFPFLQVVVQAEAAARLTARFSWLASLSHHELIVVLGVGMAIFYAIKTFVQSLLLKKQSRLMASLTATLTNSVVSHVLNARYSVYQQSSASEITGTAYSNTIHGAIALTAYIQASTEGLLLMLMFLGFSIAKPMIALSTLLLGAVMLLTLYQILIRRSAKIGAEQIRLENVRYRLLFAIASAMREIKIMGLDALFDARSRKVSQEYSEIAWRFSFNNALPRVLIELIALIAIVGFAIAVVLLDLPLSKIGPMLGLIAIAAVRAVPSMSRLFSGISAFKSSRPVVERLMDLMRGLEKDAVARIEDGLSFKDKIELEYVGFSYGEKRVLHDICLRIRRGESVGIVGPSGAGKSTLLDLITGLQQATAGEFKCDGQQFDPFTSRSIHRMVGYVPQTITLLDETIAFNVTFEEQPNWDRLMRVLGMANLQSFIESLPGGVQSRVGENGLRLSGGQRQRLGIARALYRMPEILILDEATSSLDPHSEREITSEINKLRGNITVIIVAHRLSTVQGCDHIYVMCDGEIEARGTHDELLLASRTYKKLYSSQSHGNEGGGFAINGS